MHLLLSLSPAIILGCIATASPVPSKTSHSYGAPTGFVTGFPICGTRGFTQIPGDHEIGVWPPGKVSRSYCIEACRYNGSCKAVSYAPVYKLCSFYSEYMEHDHLDQDSLSYFEHFDDVCKVECQ